jgi:hypothetical protein
MFNHWSTGEWLNFSMCFFFASGVQINGACFAPNGIFLGLMVWLRFVKNVDALLIFSVDKKVGVPITQLFKSNIKDFTV